MAVTYEQLLDWLRLIDEGIIEQKGYLTELDSAIGDGDHGANLARGAGASSAKVDAEKPEYLDELFRMVGMALISTVGGASGPLYGTFFLRLSLSVGHSQALTGEQLADALDAGVAGVLERGKPELGDKTMYDVLEPAAKAFRANLARGVSAAAYASASAAATAMDATAAMVARKGRASYLGDRSVGHIDPGAASAALMFAALAEALA
jgi:dihydroxyacetone kinase-like protein